LLLEPSLAPCQVMLTELMSDVEQEHVAARKATLAQQSTVNLVRDFDAPARRQARAKATTTSKRCRGARAWITRGCVAHPLFV
jgi:hypothetical protein